MNYLKIEMPIAILDVKQQKEKEKKKAASQRTILI